MRYAPEIALCGILLLAGCERVPHARPVALVSDETQRVRTALEQWPRPTPQSGLKRPFFATIHAAGMRTTASGVLQYYSPRDFRITAVTEMGVILFDGRMNWAGVTVMRHMPGLDEGVVQTLIGDMAHAFAAPTDLSNLKAGEEQMVLQKTLSDTHDYTWLFDRRSGRLVQEDVDLGAFDTLHVYYKSYSAMGWPEDLEIVRKARLYDISLSFTDNNVVRGTAPGGNSQ